LRFRFDRQQELEQLAAAKLEAYTKLDLNIIARHDCSLFQLSDTVIKLGPLPGKSGTNDSPENTAAW